MATQVPAPGRHSELGAFLRSRRARLTPALVGLPDDGRRRRAPGLRREEVAQLAGIGVDWYIRIEQGRAVTPSATTLESLARALVLDAAERDHLRALAASPARQPFRAETVPEPLSRLIASLNQAAYITGRRWDILAWNPAAADLFGFDRLAAPDRNIMVCMFANAATRRFFGAGWEDTAQRMVSSFRASYDFWAGDPAFTSLVHRLHGSSEQFTTWWEAHDVRNGAGGGRKTLEHPRKGTLRFEHASFQANLDPALRLVIYTPIQ
jgi:transcriptional regulator with XRE-family HTH domain